ncbi:MAG TPA: replication-associated recombination protein A [Candidatus Marinimicrobia bacterium]|nr:replication-associated recombination protein A [Candidatus Neomarinimicrobiota bacterium]
MSKNSTLQPLAERIRPDLMADFIGQSHLAGDGTLLRRAIQENALFSMILWGPPGTGKTTLAKIIARESKSDFYELTAVSSGIKEVRNVLEIGKTNRQMNRQTLLFIDEIHRFNKSQQDALLHAVEQGVILFIGATTENPSFEVISPLLSRCRVLKLQSLSEEDLDKILSRALLTDDQLALKNIHFAMDVRTELIKSAGGDARKMLNTLEATLSMVDDESGKIMIIMEVLQEALQSKTNLYDKAGDYHYDAISAFIKSVRGSDPDAAIYWLATMLEGGEKPEFIARRLIILASEDIGNADPQALPLATAGFNAVHVIGMPEASLVLAQVTTYLATAEKSNASTLAIAKASRKIREEGTSPVPLHLRNAPTPLMKSFDYGKDYDYPHNHPDHFIKTDYFPDNVSAETFYHPSTQGYEDYIKKRLKHLWKERYSDDNS